MPKEGRMDLFQVYLCKNRDENYVSKQVPGFLPASGFTYEIVTTQRDNPRFHALPSIWLASKSTGVFDTETLAPYLVPPFQPTVGLYTTFKAVYSQRKFIMSSPLLDALLGSKPRYNTIDLYTWSRANAPTTQSLSAEVMTSMNVSNSKALSAGIILWPPSYLEQSLQTARSNIEPGSRGPDNLCEITEEYRTGNAFDILASIGGLLALFQGIHVLVFGRPLFWGLFGAKLISPFGLFGKCTGDKAFRRRLRERYYRPPAGSVPPGDDRRVLDEENMDMSRFLLDYVIDMGPASPPAQTMSQERSRSPTEPLQQSSFRKEGDQEMGSSTETSVLGADESIKDRFHERTAGVV